MLPKAPLPNRLCALAVGALGIAEDSPEYASAPLRLTAARSKSGSLHLAPDEALELIRATLQGPDWLTAVAISADGTRAVSGSSDATVRVWDLEQGRSFVTLKGHVGPVLTVAISADGTRAVSGGEDRTVRVWDLTRGEAVAVLQGHTDSVWAVAISADGTRAVSGGGDRTIRVWDLETGSCLLTVWHGRVTTLALSGGTREVRLVTGESTGAVSSYLLRW